MWASESVRFSLAVERRFRNESDGVVDCLFIGGARGRPASPSVNTSDGPAAATASGAVIAAKGAGTLSCGTGEPGADELRCNLCVRDAMGNWGGVSVPFGDRRR